VSEITSAPLVLVIPNQVARLHSLCTEVHRHLEASGGDEAAIYTVELVLEELVGNVLQYGYEPGARGEIRVEIAAAATEIRIVLSDDGRPFDPTRQPEPTPAHSIAEAPVGGRGIALVRRSVRALRYRREAGRNRIEIDVARAVRSD
jgi:anti-sigma regulatory factor (Ser/Thr protein kinase)